MSRSAVFRYKGKPLDAQRVGREIGVDGVLVGRVDSREGRLLISTELVDVANGWQLWGENYDRGSCDIFEVQDEIARQISAALRLRLTGDEGSESPNATRRALRLIRLISKVATIGASTLGKVSSRR